MIKIVANNYGIAGREDEIVIFDNLILARGERKHSM